MEDKIYLTVQELTKILGISKPTIYKMIQDGTLLAINTGRKYLISTESIKKPGIKPGKTKGVG